MRVVRITVTTDQGEVLDEATVEVPDAVCTLEVTAGDVWCELTIGAPQSDAPAQQ